MTSILAALMLLQIQSSNGTITGQILSVDGTPAAAVRVTAKTAANIAAGTTADELVSISQTDTAGRFRLENVPPGQYYITAGLVASPTYYPGTLQTSNAKVVSTTAGSVTAVPPFTVQMSSVSASRVAAVANSVDTRPEHLPSLVRTVSVDSTQTARQLFEMVGKMSGIRVVFDRRFVDGAPAPAKIEGKTALQAFDDIAQRSSSTWLPINNDTIAVVPVTAGTNDLDLNLTEIDLRTGSDFAEFHPDNDLPHLFNLNGSSRDLLSSIAQASGVTVLFDRDYRAPTGAQLNLKLENVNVSTALEIVSQFNHTFWVPLNGNTILVAEDIATKRRDISPRVFKVYFPPDARTLQAIQNAAQTSFSSFVEMSWINTAGAFVVKSSPSKIAFIDKTVSELNPAVSVRTSTMVSDTAGNVFAVEQNVLQDRTPRHDALKAASAGPYTIDITERTAQVFLKLADLSGMHMLLNPAPRFTPATLQLNLKGEDLFTALDRLSFQTRTFWIPLNSKTIFVADDQSTNRRDFEPTVVKVFYFPLLSYQDITRVMNIVRQTLNLASAVVEKHANAIIIRDTAQKQFMAEWLIGELMDPAAGISHGPVGPIHASSPIEVGTISGSVARDSFSIRDGAPIRSILDPAKTGPMKVDISGDIRTIFETVGKQGGVDVQFDSRLPSGGFFTSRFDSDNLQDALNILSLQTRTFVAVIDEKTIKVAPATSAVVNDPEYQRQKVIALHNIHSSEDLTSILNVTRQVLLPRNVVLLAETNSIEVHGTALQIRAAEDLITALDIP